MNIFFLSLFIGALAIPMEKVPGTKPMDVLMSEDKGIADAEVPMAKVKAPIAKAHEPKPDLSHLSMLEKFKHDPKYFVSQMSKADPRTLRTILGLLNDMLTTSEDRELHLHGNWDTAQDELDVANADVIAAEGVLSGAEQDQTDAATTLATANADLIAKRAVQTDAQTEKNDAQTSYDDAIGSLDDEQEVLQKVISILSELLGKQPETRYQLVGNGWCLGVDRNRINMPGYSWTQTDIKPDGSASLCAQQCATTEDCIGYMSEDQSKCDILLTSDKNAATGIASVDGQTRNFCWRKKTQHSAAYKFVGNGWCMNANNNRINMPGYSWSQTDIKQDGSASLCAQQCSAAQNCIGYMSEDMSKCDILLTSDKNAASGIASVDGETRNFCWQKRTQG